MSKQPSNRPNNSLFAPLGIGFFIGALTIGTIVLVWKHDESRAHPASSTSDTRPTPAAVPILDAAVFRVAALFVCSCGICGEKRLDICSCETARTERAFIQEQLRNGRSESEAADAVNKKYGGLKS